MDANNPTSSKPDTSDQGGIIEEKVSKVGGESSVRKYSKGRLLGKGGFAKCYEVTNIETGRVYAAKIIVKATLTKARSRQKLISEIKIHKSLKHAGVVLFEHVFEDQENVYMLLELCANQSLHDLLKRRKKLTEVEVQCYIVQLVNGLKYLHNHRVIHRDLKLGNLFITDKMELKLGDFGLAAKLEFDGEKRRTVCGTPNYIAPEVIEGKSGHSYEVDIWAVGVIMYALLIGKPPFETPEVKQTYKKIKICSYSFPENAGISDHARSLITRILSLDPSKRPTLDEILQHPFINNGGAVPKLLPVSTLACPPSASYLKQYLPQGNTVPIMMDPPKFGENGTFTSTKNGRFFTAQKNNLMSSTSDRGGFFNKPQSPSAQAQTQAQTQTHTQTGETISSGHHFERQGSRGDTWTLSKAGAYQMSSMGSTGSLKTSARPHTVAQKEFRSSAALKPTQPSPIQQLGSTAGLGFGLNKGRTSMSSNEVWVKKWVDYSSKYGLGYLLSNGTSGVFFNDNTKIMMNAKATKFEYVDKNVSTKQDTKTVHTFEQYPKELQKKVTLLQHFKKYLDGDDKEGVVAEDNEKNAGVYVKKWLKTKYAMMFRLSNKIVQMNFTDKTEIILSSENKMVTYLNKKGERNHFPLATALESTNTDMTKRLKYTKEVLSHMIGDGQQNTMPTLNY